MFGVPSHNFIKKGEPKINKLCFTICDYTTYLLKSSNNYAVCEIQNTSAREMVKNNSEPRK